MKHPKSHVFSYIRILFLCCLLLCSFVPFSASAKIVFCADGAIFVMNDNGSRKRRLTQSTQATHRYPRWSPDGTKIAFTRYMDKTKRQSSSELFIMNADGTNLQRLTHNNFGDGHPSWSPDGTRIVFDSRRSGQFEVYVIELATLTVTQLTEGELGSGAPDWSPDGTQIVYEKFIRNAGIGFAHKNIYIMSTTGENQRPLFLDPKADAEVAIMRFFPRWSADGKRIVFSEVQWLEDGAVEKLTIQRIGGRTQVITDVNDRLGNNWLGTSACWMDNDRAILFSLMLNDKPNPNYNLYRYGIETRGLRRLTSTASDEEWPDWTEGALSVSPHGKLTTQWAKIKVEK